MIHKIIEKIAYKKPNKKYDLEAILNHVVQNTKYYKNFNSKNINSFSILTKEIIRNNFEDLKSKDLSSRKWWINTSGGSTGEPVKFIQDKEYLLANRFTTYNQKKKLGYRFGDNFIKLWGDEREILKYRQSFKTKFLNKLKNITFLNSFNMTQENMFKFVEEINTKQPKLIVAYAQSMYELAKFIKENSLKIKNVGAIITSAGTLYPFMRNVIERNLNTKVYNRYGSREVGNIACEEPNIDGLVISDGVYIEIVDDSGELCKDGIEGEIIVTSLINYAMPLIRYKIGDRGILNTTKYNFPILEKVSGRNVNMFKTKDGKLIDGEYFTHLIYHIEWIKKFQIIQKTHDLIEIKIVKNLKSLKKDLDDIENGVKKAMGESCEVKFDFMDEISPLKSGKYLYTICELD
jgi:phenylacetate-CoA ligase